LAAEALEMLEVDKLGLDSLDRKYLQVLATVFGGGPAGMQAVAHSLNIAGETIENEVEPFLLRVGFVQRTPRGRMITAAALTHMGLTLDGEPDGSQQGQLFE
jgi:Holliday junction DNA helicase RuvB